MFKLQQLELFRWVNVNEDFKSRLPTDVDILAYLKMRFPSAKFRFMYVKKGESK